MKAKWHGARQYCANIVRKQMNYSRLQGGAQNDHFSDRESEGARLERYNRLVLCIAEYRAQESCLLKLTEEQELLVFRRLQYSQNEAKGAYQNTPQHGKIDSGRGNIIDLPISNRRLNKDAIAAGELPKDIENLDKAIDRAAFRTEELLAKIMGTQPRNSDEAVLKLRFLSEHLFQSDLAEQELITQDVNRCLAILGMATEAQGNSGG